MRRSASLAETPLSAARNLEHPSDLHLLVQPALLGQVPDAIEDGLRRIRVAKDIDLPLVGRDDVQDHPNCRRLAGAVGSEKSVNGPFRYAKRQVAHRDVPRVTLYDVLDVDG